MRYFNLLVIRYIKDTNFLHAYANNDLHILQLRSEESLWDEIDFEFLGNLRDRKSVV